MKVVVVLLLALLLTLQYRLWFGRGSRPEVARAAQARQELQQENQRLLERNASLAAEVLDLKQGLEAIEEKARSEMGMIKHGETFYQIVDKPEASVMPQAEDEE